MRRFITTVLLGVASGSVAFASPDAIYQNPGVVNQPPTIDAVVFENFGTFDLETLAAFTNVTVNVGRAIPLPYSTSDTSYYTNAPSGTMIGIPGFRFDTATRTTRFSALEFVNQGSIIGQDIPPIAESYSTSGSTATTPIPQDSQPTPSQVLIYATNVVNQGGSIGVGNYGLLQIKAQNFTNSFGSIAAGGINTGGSTITSVLEGLEISTDQLDTTGRGAYGLGTGYFVNPPYVYDLFWGVTNGGKLAVDALANTLPGTTPINFISRNTGTGFIQSVGNTGIASEYACYIDTFNTDPTNIYYNIVFVNTNFADSNISAAVEFTGYNIAAKDVGDLRASAAVVQFSVPTTDIITGDTVTNAIYLIDTGAALTNIFLWDNAGTPNNYDRPECFESTTVTPIEWLESIPATPTVFDPTVIYQAGSFVNTSVPYIGAIYGAQFGRNPENLAGSFSTASQLIDGALEITGGITLPDPTNEAARIDITAGQADLTQARIRSEGIVMLNITNLIGGGSGVSDWGITDSSIGSTNGNLMIANLFPTNFQRVRGTIDAWCTTWQNIFTNAVTTNNYHMHVLVVNQGLRGNFKSSIRNLALHGSSTVTLQNDLTVINQTLFDASNLVLNANVTLTQGAGNVYPSNIFNLKSLFINTNASLSVDGVLDIGYSLSQGLPAPGNGKFAVSSIVNLGSITATAPLFESAVFTNAGTITAIQNGSMVIDAGQIVLGSTATNSTNALIAEGTITLSGESIFASNSLIAAGATVPGSLILDVTGRLSDGVSGAPSATSNLVNFWQVTDGFSLPYKPSTGDLFGTEIRTMAGQNTYATHVWAGVDMGPIPAGFMNNAVIGHLVLDRLTNSAVLHFTGAGTDNGMYVDYLELADFSYSDYRNGLIIDPNLKIYFAAANADVFKLMAVYPGSLIWVSNFWGPNSTAAVPYFGSTNVCLMNSSLASSPDIGFFGIPNSYNEPNVLNDPSNPSIIAPCPVLGDAAMMSMFVVNPYKQATKQQQEAWLATCAITNSLTSNVFQSVIVAANGQGSVGPALTSKQLAVGSTATLTATPAKGWIFSGWSTSGVDGNSATLSSVLKFTIRTNAVITANFVPNPFNPLQGSYNGLFYDTNQMALDRAGFFILTLQPSGAFSGHLLIGASNYTFSSQFYGAGTQQVQAVNGKQSLTVNLTLDLTGVTGQISGDVKGASWDSALSADLAPAWTTKNPSPLAGTYTMILPGAADIGDSFGAVTVSKTGVLSVTGTLADGTGFSQSAPLSKDGQWPFYTYAAAGKDTVVGWVSVNSQEGLAGTNLVWSKAPGIGKYYNTGFERIVQLIGSPYAAPKTKPSYSLFEPATNLVSLTLNASKGTFTGKFGKGQAMSGVVLQNENDARGFYLGTGKSGQVLLNGN
jgi:hypothetical protein